MTSALFFPVLFVFFSLFFSWMIDAQSTIPPGSPIRVGVVYSNATGNAFQTWLIGQKMYPALFERFVDLFKRGEISGLSSPILNDGTDMRNIQFIPVNAYNPATPTVASLNDIKAATLTLLKKPADQRPHVLICPLGDAAEGCLLANEDPVNNIQGPVPAICPGTPNTAQFQCLLDPITNKLPANCFRVGQRRFNYAFSILADGQRYFQPYVAVLRLANAKSVVVITEDAYSFNSHVTIGALNALRDSKIDAHIFTLPNSRVNRPVIAVELAQKIVDFIGTLNQEPDALFVATQSCYDLPSLFAQVNYAPKSMIMVQCFAAGIEDVKRSVLKYHYIPIQWDPRLKGAQYSETPKSLVPLFVEAASTQISYTLITNRQPNVNMINTTQNVFTTGSGSSNANIISSPAQFSFFYQQVMGALPDYATGAVCAGFTTFLGALRLANSTNPQALVGVLNSYYETSYYGLLTFNRYGYNEQRDVGLAQYDSDGLLQIVAPLGAATASQIYPMPSWDDRVYIKKMYGKTEEVAMFIVIAIVGVATISLMAAVLHYKKNPIIKAASWLFASVMGIGCLMAYLSILTWPLENDEITCSARHWFYTVPFHIFMDPLIAKSLRILRIFFADQFKVQKISDRLVALHSFLLFLPQLIINIAWSAMDAPSPVIKTPDPLRAAKNYTDCSGSHTTAFIAVSLVYAMVIVTFGCIMAYKVRLTVGMFNDAKSIAMAIYMFSVPSVIIGAIQLFIADSNNRSALFVLRSIGLLMSYFTAFTILYLPRLLDVYFNAPLDNVYRSSVQGKQNGEKGGSGLHAPLTPVRTVYMVPNDNKEKQLVNDKGGRDRNNSIGDKEDNGLINRESKSTAQSNNTTLTNGKDNHLHPHRGSIGDRASMSSPTPSLPPPVSTLGGGGGGKLPMIPKVKSALTTKASATTANNLSKPIQCE